MDLTEINRGLSSIVTKCNSVYAEFARAKAEHESLDNHKKTILAVCELKHNEGSQAEIARKGLADEDYRKHLVALDHSAVSYAQALANVKALETKLACYQSLSKNYMREFGATNTQS